jgi:hypothetical protein
MSATPREVWSRLYEGEYTVQEAAWAADVSIIDAAHALETLYAKSCLRPRWDADRLAHVYRVPLHLAKGPWQAKDPNWEGHARAAAYKAGVRHD